jgi:2-oxo-hept-3-ene-1,7-dioate hydratase
VSLDEPTLAQAAQRLEQAERTRVACRQFSLDHPEMTIDDAYAIQHAWMRLKVDNGRAVKGHKIGLTSKAMQRAVGIAEPDYGTLLDDMFYRDGAVVPADRFLQLKIEAELAFVLRKPLSGPGCTLFDVLDATAYVTPALEILDARIQRVDPETQRTRKVVDTISDNAANAA